MPMTQIIIVIPSWKDGVDQSPEVVDTFVRWSEKNYMSCNPRKCKELTLHKKGFLEELCKMYNNPEGRELKLLGVIFPTITIIIIVNTLVTCVKSLQENQAFVIL